MAQRDLVMRPFTFTVYYPNHHTGLETSRQTLTMFFQDQTLSHNMEFLVQIADTHMESFITEITRIRDVLIPIINLVALVFKTEDSTDDFYSHVEAQLLCIPRVFTVHLRGVWRIQCVQNSPELPPGANAQQATGTDAPPHGEERPPRGDGGPGSPANDTIAARMNKRPWLPLLEGTPLPNCKVTPRRVHHSAPGESKQTASPLATPTATP
eukprot:3517142-Rhodomonas_salina.1